MQYLSCYTSNSAYVAKITKNSTMMKTLRQSINVETSWYIPKSLPQGIETNFLINGITRMLNSFNSTCWGKKVVQKLHYGTWKNSMWWIQNEICTNIKKKLVLQIETKLVHKWAMNNSHSWDHHGLDLGGIITLLLIIVCYVIDNKNCYNLTNFPSLESKNFPILPS
jgi:hypothetical protein